MDKEHNFFRGVKLDAVSAAAEVFQVKKNEITESSVLRYFR
jgi:hypothetical protein